MLVRFTVLPTLLAVNREQKELNPALVSEHRRLCELILRLGILCLPSDRGERESLWKTITALPDPLRKYWELVALKGRVEDVAALNALGSMLPRDLTSSSVGHVALICVPDGAIKGNEATRAIGVEICELHRVDFSRAFQEAERESGEPIWQGSATEAVWSRKFRSLFQSSTRATIVDRYLIRNLLDSVPTNGSALDHLLHWAGRDAPRCHVQVLTSLVGNKQRNVPVSTPDECFDALEGAWRRVSQRGRCPASFGVYVIPDRWFSEEVHGRHIRFEDRCVVEIDPGLEVLEKDVTRRMCTFSLKRLELSSEHGARLAKLQETGQKRAAGRREWRREEVSERPVR